MIVTILESPVARRQGKYSRYHEGGIVRICMGQQSNGLFGKFQVELEMHMTRQIPSAINNVPRSSPMWEELLLVMGRYLKPIPVSRTLISNRVCQFTGDPWEAMSRPGFSWRGVFPTNFSQTSPCSLSNLPLFAYGFDDVVTSRDAVASVYAGEFLHADISVCSALLMRGFYLTINELRWVIDGPMNNRETWQGVFPVISISGKIVFLKVCCYRPKCYDISRCEPDMGIQAGIFFYFRHQHR